MTRKSEAIAEKLREFIKKQDLRKRVPAEIKAEVVAYATSRHQAGWSFGKTARDLGLHDRTLSRWCSEEAVAREEAVSIEDAEFREVDVSGDPTAADSRLLVTLPNGIRIEGSDVVRISALVRRLV